MNKKEKIISRLKTITQNSISQILGVVSVLLLSFIIVKFHSVELWGQYAKLLIWSNFFLLFLSFGNHDFLLKSFSDSPSTINQQWVSNLLARSILLIPSCILLYFIPIFKGVELLIFLLILLQFLTQSFKVLILYHLKFTFNIWIELLYNLCLVIIILSILRTLDLRSLLITMIIVQGVKLICYSVFLLKGFNNMTYQLQFKSLNQSIPFFIPLALGTIRVKVDAYYGTYFFSVSDLSKYQIFLSFLILAQMASAFVISPFLKNIYRSNNVIILKLQQRFFVFGWLFAFLMSIFMYAIIKYIYELEFTTAQYFLGFTFMIPLFLQVLIVSEYYKKNKQNKIAIIALIVVIAQIVSGYYLVKFWSINGALFLKAAGQWGIIMIQWLWLQKIRKNA